MPPSLLLLLLISKCTARNAPCGFNRGIRHIPPVPRMVARASMPIETSAQSAYRGIPGQFGAANRAHLISVDENCYAFPPFSMVGPLIAFIMEEQLQCSLIIPVLNPIPVWFTTLQAASSDIRVLGQAGERGIQSMGISRTKRVYHFRLRSPDFRMFRGQ